MAEGASSDQRACSHRCKHRHHTHKPPRKKKKKNQIGDHALPRTGIGLSTHQAVGGQSTLTQSINGHTALRDDTLGRRRHRREERQDTSTTRHSKARGDRRRNGGRRVNTHTGRNTNNKRSHQGGARRDSPTRRTARTHSIRPLGRRVKGTEAGAARLVRTGPPPWPCVGLRSCNSRFSVASNSRRACLRLMHAREPAPLQGQRAGILDFETSRLGPNLCLNMAA